MECNMRIERIRQDCKVWENGMFESFDSQHPREEASRTSSRGRLPSSGIYEPISGVARALWRVLSQNFRGYVIRTLLARGTELESLCVR